MLWPIRFVLGKKQVKHDKKYYKFLSSMPCVICGKSSGVELHHVLKKSHGGNCYNCVPLCKYHHDFAHGKADNNSYIKKYGLENYEQEEVQNNLIMLQASLYYLVRYFSDV